MQAKQLVQFTQRCVARGIDDLVIYRAAKRRYSATLCPAKIRRLMQAMGVFVL